jgi:hypothetical protein
MIVKVTQNKLALAAATLGVGWSLWELTFLPYRVGVLHPWRRLEAGDLGNLLTGVAAIVAPWVLLAASAWLITKKRALAALVMFIVFAFMFLVYLFPVGISSLTAISGGSMEWTRTSTTLLVVFVIFLAGACLSWMAYRAANQGRL